MKLNLSNEEASWAAKRSAELFPVLHKWRHRKLRRKAMDLATELMDALQAEPYKGLSTPQQMVMTMAIRGSDRDDAIVVCTAYREVIRRVESIHDLIQGLPADMKAELGPIVEETAREQGEDPEKIRKILGF